MHAYLWRILTADGNRIKSTLSDVDVRILRVIHAPQDVASAAWSSYKENGYDIDSMYPNAIHLIPTLSKRLQTIAPDEPWLDKLKGYYRYTFTKNQIHLKTIHDLFSGLDSMGIEAVLLGDIPLLLNVFKDAGERAILYHAVFVQPENYARTTEFIKSSNVPAKGPPVEVFDKLPAAMQETVTSDPRSYVTMCGASRMTLSAGEMLLFNLLVGSVPYINQAVWFTDMVKLASTCSADPAQLNLIRNRLVLTRTILPAIKTWSFFEKIAREIGYDPKDNASLTEMFHLLPLPKREVKNSVVREITNKYNDLKSTAKAPPPNRIDEIMQRFARKYTDVFFVQVGSCDGSIDDPISKYVRKYRWPGILIEPVPYVFRRLTANFADHDNLKFLNVAISEKDECRDFYYIAETNDPIPEWYHLLGSFYRDVIDKTSHGIPNAQNRIVSEPINCISWQTLVESNRIEKLDLLQIDTEGYDFEVIKQIDFSRLRPAVIIYEHRHLSGRDRGECLTLLQSKNYAIVEDEYNTCACLSELL